MTKRYAFLSPALLMVMALSGCDYLPFGYAQIKDIAAAPANFEGKEVKLKGKVSNITKVPFLELKSFILQDGTGEISVATDGNLPAVGDKVALAGTVKSAVIVGGQSLGLHVKEIRRLP